MPMPEEEQQRQRHHHGIDAANPASAPVSSTRPIARLTPITTCQADRHRLEHKLAQHIAIGGAERLAHADLAGALGHNHQHNVP